MRRLSAVCRCPNFFIPGAPKAGTTSLYHDLRQHPQVCMSEPKETWFFFDYRKYEEGSDWYTSKFFSHCDGQQIIGEATPGYMAHPDSAQRIVESLGTNCQFLFLLRNPIDRAFSQFHYDVQRGVREASQSFSDVIRDPVEQSSDPSRNHVGLLENGRYIVHLKRYERYFSRKQLHPILFGDYTKKREDTLRKIFDILGLSPVPIRKQKLHNRTQYPVSPSLFTFLQQAWSVTERLLGSAAEMLGSFRDVTRKILLSASQERPSMSSTDRLYLQDFYADVNADLSEYIGRDLSHWR